MLETIHKNVGVALLALNIFACVLGILVGNFFLAAVNGIIAYLLYGSVKKRWENAGEEL